MDMDELEQAPKPEPQPEPEPEAEAEPVTGPVLVELDADVWRGVLGALHGRRDARLVEANVAITDALS